MNRPEWYEPFSRFRKVCWWWCLAVACFCMPGAFIGETPRVRHDYSINVIFNLVICWLAFDSTFKIKKDEDYE